MKKVLLVTDISVHLNLDEPHVIENSEVQILGTSYFGLIPFVLTFYFSLILKTGVTNTWTKVDVYHRLNGNLKTTYAWLCRGYPDFSLTQSKNGNVNFLQD